MGDVQKRLSIFVKWIATESEKEDEIREQANNIRENISTKAKEDGLIVRSTPNAGSFPKRDGNRRHLRGYSVVEGQDVDLPFVLAPPKNEETLSDLLKRFSGYADVCYPNTDKKLTKSSVKLTFSKSKISYDLVPMLATEDPQRQIIIRADGEKFETSVQGHIAFVRERTQDSQLLPGRVKFNECVRLLKWWREFRVDESNLFEEVPSIAIELICGKVYDLHGVKFNYADTLAQWFGRAAHIIRNREPIFFNEDFSKTDETWKVIDPQNATNNIVAKWKGYQIDELADWFEQARDLCNQLLRQDLLDDRSGSLATLVELFGTPIQHHSSQE